MAASYLPQLIRTQIEYPFRVPLSKSDGRSMHFDWTTWIGALLSSVAFNRFVRERPTEAIALERNFVECISRISPEEIAVRP